MTQNKLFPLQVSNMEKYVFSVKENNESKLWHLRYGHLNVRGLKLLSQKEMVSGLPTIENIGLCENCVFGKQSRRPFPVDKTWRASHRLDLVHADLCGPMKTETFGGSRYFLLFIDDFSRMS